MNLSEKLQKLRKENNITQESLADKLNVSRQAVSKWESGGAYPDTEKLIQISKIFNVSLDELVNGNIDKNNDSSFRRVSFMEIINSVLEFVSKTVNMFWSMKFIEKIKCLFEMIILILIIFGVAMLSTSIIVNLIRRIFLFLPSEFVYGIGNILEVLLFLVWFILGGIIVIKIFKSRYLDYYVFLVDDSVSEKVIEEPIKELKEKKAYKVVIRDPKDSSLSVVKKVGKIITFFVKCLTALLAFPLILLIIFCIVLLVYSMFFIFDGLFFNGISIALGGIILFIFLIIEFIYNLLFNRVHSVNRIFVMFVCSILLIGIGIGLSFASFTNFTFLENDNEVINTHIIEMSDDLVITSMMYDIDQNDIIIDDNLDDIKLEIISYGCTETYLYSYESYSEYNLGNDINNRNLFRVVELSIDYNEMEFYKDIINDLRERKVVSYDRIYRVKIYVSSDNLEDLRKNINEYTGNIWFN